MCQCKYAGCTCKVKVKENQILCKDCANGYHEYKRQDEKKSYTEPKTS